MKGRLLKQALLYQYLGILPNELYGTTHNTGYAFLFGHVQNNQVIDTRVYQITGDKLPPALALGTIVDPEQVYQKGKGDWYMTFSAKSIDEKMDRMQVWDVIYKQVKHVREIF